MVVRIISIVIKKNKLFIGRPRQVVSVDGGVHVPDELQIISTTL